MADWEEERCAQSNGEWPGDRRTFRRGLAGTELCVGGGDRDEDEDGGPRFGKGRVERMGGGINAPPATEEGSGLGGTRIPPEAR